MFKKRADETQKYLSEAIGNNSEQFEKNLNWLKNRWSGKEDGTAERVICPVLYLHTSSLNQSIIVDNLSYFEKNYIKEKMNSNELLAIACLCGSRQIAEFLLNELKQNYLSQKYEFILGYVTASPNLEWAKEIARILSEACRPMPNDVFRLANFDTVEVLEKIFMSKKPTKISLEDVGDNKATANNKR